MTIKPLTGQWALRSWVTMAVGLVMLLKAVLAPLAVAAASQNTAPGTILVPLCIGGVIEYVEIDLLSGEGDGSADETPAVTVVAAMDCSVLGAFVMPCGPIAGTAPTASMQADPPSRAGIAACREAEHLRPPMRGPPSLS